MFTVIRPQSVICIYGLVNNSLIKRACARTARLVSRRTFHYLNRYG